MQMNNDRERWGSRLGVVLAVAGSAVGLGNFLRFPAKATLNGGGAFMVPYFVALLLLGIPLMWIEWTIGRMGGLKGHGTAPGIFDGLARHPSVKYLGTLGILGPFVILIYYLFIESWALAYAWFSLSGALFTPEALADMKGFLGGYLGLAHNGFFSGIGTAYIFFLITFFINFYFIYRGINKGIEVLSKYGMPIMIALGILLAIRVLTLGTPDPAQPDLSVNNALGFVWNPDFSKLADARVWMEAAGQIFFTLSVGIGVILTYASYLKKTDDVALSGLSSTATNEFCEVILGGSIIIPAAFIFLGQAGALEVAKSGTFNLGFVTMPLIFGKIPLGNLFAALWFVLLFIAAITSSVSLIQPAVAFLEDEFKIRRERAAVILGAIAFAACQPAIFFLGHGFVDELDFWGGTIFLVVFATVETILFAWVLGIDKGLEALHEGADIKLPEFYKFIMKYVTPVYLLGLLGMWGYQQFWPTILMKNVAAADRPYIWGARGLIALLWVTVIALVAVAWRRRASRSQEEGQ